jgi:hypothetical protein
MEDLKRQYRALKDQLVNLGEELTMDEVMWNDGILIAMDELLEDVNEDIAKLIRLNLV